MNFQTKKTQSRVHISATVSRIALAVALTLSANGAMAATSQVHKTIKPAHTVQTHRAAAKSRQFTQRQFGLPDFVAAAFGGFAAPYVLQASRAAGRHAPAASGDDYNSQVFDNSPAPDIVDNSQSQAAIDASDAATQQVDQDTFQMDESVISSEAQNDAANAAMQQDMVNNGM